MEFCNYCQVFQKSVIDGEKQICRRCGNEIVENSKSPESNNPAPAPVATPSTDSFPWQGIVQTVILVLLLILVFQQISEDDEKRNEDKMNSQVAQVAQNKADVGAIKDDVKQIRGDLRELENQLEEVIKEIIRQIDVVSKNQASMTEVKDSLARKELGKIQGNLSTIQAAIEELDQKRVALEKKQTESKKRKPVKPFKHVLVGIGNAPKTAPGAGSETVPAKPAETQNGEVTPDTPEAVKPSLDWYEDWIKNVSLKSVAARRSFIYSLIDDKNNKKAIRVFVSALEDPDVVVRRFGYTGLKEATKEALPFVAEEGIEVRKKQIKAWKQALEKYLK